MGGEFLAGGEVVKHFGGRVAKTFWSGGVAKNFLLPHPSNVCLYDCPLHHNSMSLIDFQHLCVIFLRVNIYASLPNDLKI